MIFQPISRRIYGLFSLANIQMRGYCLIMFAFSLRLLCISMFSLVFCASCRKTERIVVNERRELIVADQGNHSLVAVMPPEWRQVPSTEFRMFNYRFGDSGEVFVGRSRGGLMPNINRWLGQFGKPGLENADELPKVMMLGQEGVLVTASGDFAGGMGRAARENAGLAGVIVAIGDQLITVKMMGDADAVAAEQERLIKFCEGLRIRSDDSK